MGHFLFSVSFPASGKQYRTTNNSPSIFAVILLCLRNEYYKAKLVNIHNVSYSVNALIDSAHTFKIALQKQLIFDIMVYRKIFNNSFNTIQCGIVMIINNCLGINCFRKNWAMDITIIIREKRIGVVIQDNSNLVQIMSKLQVHPNWSFFPYRYRISP